MDSSYQLSKHLTRREFVKSMAAAGVGFALSQTAAAQSAAGSGDEIVVGIIGTGSQGRNLIVNTLKIPGIRFVAICDVWEYSQRYASKAFTDEPKVYSDYREMLDKEKDLDAVIVATPDWNHAEHTIACLEAGKHVYCEKEMSNTLDGARKMALAAKRTGKLLQIGHQRRSNPRYWHALQMIYKEKICGRITHINGQWNRSRRLDVGWPKNYTLDDKTLAALGYGGMDEFRNWRWYKKYSGGPIADLGSHQIDVFNWFLNTRPKQVIATGGKDYYTDRDWYDNIMTFYAYDGAQGPVRAFYQVLNTTSYGGFFEAFMGDEGTMVISEDSSVGYVFREPQAKRRDWEAEADMVEKGGRHAIQLKIGETLSSDGTPDPKAQALAAQALKPVHQLHLENFFNAIRGDEKLTCPAEVAFETAATVLAANESLDKGTPYTFKPDDFKV